MQLKQIIMRNLLTAATVLCCCLLISACSTSPDNDSHPRFGTWNKVSATKGVYVGMHNLPTRAVLGAHPAFRGEAAGNTTTIDTSYIDNPGQISLQVKSHQFRHKGYYFHIALIDSSPPFRPQWTSAQYISDSTAFTATDISTYEWYPDHIRFKKKFIINCNHQQAKKEYLDFSFSNKDSTKFHTYKIRVDGMYDIVSDITGNCYKH
jgi:hypothetical protein